MNAIEKQINMKNIKNETIILDQLDIEQLYKGKLENNS